MNQVYYKSSGKFSMLAFLCFIVFQLIAIPILSIIYTYLTYYIPFIYLNVIITIGCGIAAGYVMKSIVKLGKIRNTALAAILGVFAALILKYVQWCVYVPLIFSDLYEVFKADFIERLLASAGLLLDPGTTLECMYEINQVGVWTLSNIDITGVFLGIVWVIEFLIIMGITVYMSCEAAKIPFCEDDLTWYKEMPQKLNVSMPENPVSSKAKMENGNFEELVSVDSGASKYLELTFYKPGTDERRDLPCYLSINQITLGEKDKKKQETFCEYMLVKQGVMEALYGRINGKI